MTGRITSGERFFAFNNGVAAILGAAAGPDINPISFTVRASVLQAQILLQVWRVDELACRKSALLGSHSEGIRVCTSARSDVVTATTVISDFVAGRRVVGPSIKRHGEPWCTLALGQA